MNYADVIRPEFSWAGEGLDIRRLTDPVYLKRLTELSGQQDAVEFLQVWCNPDSYVPALSSGTTGPPKLLRLSKRYMLQSARRSANFFQFSSDTRGLMVLPARYIGGKMMLLRALISGMQLEFVPPSTQLSLPARGRWHFVSLTPHLALLNPSLLSRCRTVLLGGAQVPDRLIHVLQEQEIHAFESYGSTETMSHVALRRLSPRAGEAFVALSGVEFGQDERGCLRIDAPDLGIFGLQTNDVVALIDRHRFQWLGRYDFVINSGGIKIFPEKIERILGPHFDCRLLIVPRPHPVLGEEAVLVLEKERITEEDWNRLTGVEGLEKAARPRGLLAKASFPLTPGDKVDRRKLIHWVARH